VQRRFFNLLDMYWAANDPRVSRAPWLSEHSRAMHDEAVWCSRIRLSIQACTRYMGSIREQDTWACFASFLHFHKYIRVHVHSFCFLFFSSTNDRQLINQLAYDPCILASYIIEWRLWTIYLTHIYVSMQF
jgi:hypothetical protein